MQANTQKLLALICSLLFTGWTWTLLAEDGLAALPERLGLEVMGFADVRAGLRTQDDPHEESLSLGEARLQLDVIKAFDWATFEVKSDFIYEEAKGDRNLDLETGAGAVDLREANVLFSPLSFIDVKAGRQILTWGTGDLIFINDMFPKDWQSFFLGRDEEYLKAPSDAVFVSLFPEFASIDIAYAPQFDADRYVRGERLSYWNQALGDLAGRSAVVNTEDRDQWFRDDEIAVRVSKNTAGYELSLYGYKGFWKSPEGMNPAAGRAVFPELAVYGASGRGALGAGVFSLEAGYYDSREDRDGDDRDIPNSEWRFLAGYEREIGRDFTAGIQYYLEYMDDYGQYNDDLLAGWKARDRGRHTLTLRLTKQLLNQNLTLLLFARYSPSDLDAYLRPVVKYKLTDAWLLTAGGNIFLGEEDHTFLGQFEKNSNVYVGTRYSF